MCLINALKRKGGLYDKTKAITFYLSQDIEHHSAVHRHNRTTSPKICETNKQEYTHNVMSDE